MAHFFALGLVGHVVIGGNPGFGFGLAGFLTLAHPVQFPFKCFLLGFVFTRFLRQAFGFLFQPCGVVAFIRHALAAVDF